MKHFLSYLSGTVFLTCAASLLAQNGLTEPQQLTLKSVRTADTVIDITHTMADASQNTATPAQNPPNNRNGTL